MHWLSCGCRPYGSDLMVNGTLTIKDWQEGQFGIRLKDLPDDPQEPTAGASGLDYKYIHHYEQVGVDAEWQPIYAPAFADFFDDGPNNTEDGTAASRGRHMICCSRGPRE